MSSAPTQPLPALQGELTRRDRVLEWGGCVDTLINPADSILKDRERCLIQSSGVRLGCAQTNIPAGQGINEPMTRRLLLLPKWKTLMIKSPACFILPKMRKAFSPAFEVGVGILGCSCPSKAASQQVKGAQVVQLV